MTINPQPFELSIQLIAAKWQLSNLDLSAYAREDSIGGYHSDPTLQKWYMGSLWEVEGKILYGLARLLKAEKVADLGTHVGCSATHFAAAMHRNGNGHVYSLDVSEASGADIPAVFRSYISLIHEDAKVWLSKQPENSFDIIYEDLGHDAETSMYVAQLALTRLKPGGFLLVHDAEHFGVGIDIRTGLDAALGANNYQTVLSAPSDCGLALWRRKEEALPYFEQGKGWVAYPTPSDLAPDDDDALVKPQPILEDWYPKEIPLEEKPEPFLSSAPAVSPGQTKSATASSSGVKASPSSVPARQVLKKARKARADKGVKRTAKKSSAESAER